MGKTEHPILPTTISPIAHCINLSHRFTTRGKVALAFSCLCGILGVIVVVLYGLAPDAAAPEWVEQRAAETQVPDSAVRSSGGTGAEPELVTVTAVSGGGNAKA